MKRKLNKAAKKDKPTYWKIFAWVFVLSFASNAFNDFKETISSEDCVQETIEIAWNARSVVIPVKCKTDNSLKTALNEQKRDIKYKP